jgi:alkanesulfonate monooxygenase SsuD/methylene tetrahydromethanopterin reductase-like flavin-dependent oxidoreductase (luciferase family)
VAIDTHPAPSEVTAPTRQRLRLGFLTHLHVGENAADSYRIALDLFQAAEQLGFESGWVAQHHFQNGAGRLPSTLTFLAAAAERTRRIRLGTAIIILPLEDPIRLAEDAAVVDTLSGGRLELGLGTGGDPLTFAAFGRELGTRRVRYGESVRALRDALAGLPINGTKAVLYPPAPALAARIWESTLSPEGGARIGRNGNGLLLARTAFMSSEPTDANQLPVAEAYVANLPPAGAVGAQFIAPAPTLPGPAPARNLPGPAPAQILPRVGLSRAVYPADDRRSAVDQLDAGVQAYVGTMIERGFFPPGLSQEGYYARSHIHYGHPEEVVASLQADKVLPYTTELICQVHPGHPTPKQIERVLERIAQEVAPALGWQPDRGPDEGQP